MAEPSIKLTIWRIIQLSVLAIFSPKRFAEIEKEEIRNRDLDAPPVERDRLTMIRRGYMSALFWSLVAIAVGAVSATLWTPAVPSKGVAIAGCLGAGVLLWATLAVQGWNVQSMQGNTLSEFVNKWWYRALYWLGTALLAVAAVWSFGPA